MVEPPADQVTTELYGTGSQQLQWGSTDPVVFHYEIGSWLRFS